MGLQISGAVFWIPNPMIPDSTTKIFPDSIFHKQKVSGFRNRDSVTWGEQALDLNEITENRELYSLRETMDSVSPGPVISRRERVYKLFLAK